ncbi:hypothetical protein ACFE04_029334 [Oxalis oulophora]
MERFGRVRGRSPEIRPPSIPVPNQSHEIIEEFGLEGVTTNVKLLLKLLTDHQDACSRDNDGRRTQRVAGMMTILEDVKSRIQKSESVGKRRIAELRRCNTDLRPNRLPSPREQKPVGDEKEALKRHLSASISARKSLQVMCSSLGKEKEIMASELSRKALELDEMEEIISELKAQNQSLSAKVQAYAVEHNKRTVVGETPGNLALQDRNRALSEQLLKSLDGYRSLKRKYKEVKEENEGIRATLEELEIEVQAGLDQVRGFRHRLDTREEQPVDIEYEVSTIEQMLQGFDQKISKHVRKKNEFSKSKTEINTRSKAFIVA